MRTALERNFQRAIELLHGGSALVEISEAS